MTECPHRTPSRIDIRPANLCGCGRKFFVYGCDLFGECSDGKRHSAVRSCRACEIVRRINSIDADNPADTIIS